MSMFSYGTRPTCARATAASVAASTSPGLASTPRCSRYAAAERSGSWWPFRLETLPVSGCRRDRLLARAQERADPVDLSRELGLAAPRQRHDVLDFDPAVTRPPEPGDDAVDHHRPHAGDGLEAAL